MSGIESTLSGRLLTTNRTASAAALTAGRYTMTTLAAALSVTEAVAAEMIVPLGPSSVQSTTRRRGVEVSLFGDGSNDQTVSAKVWRLKRANALGGTKAAADFEVLLIGTIAGTMGTQVGATGGEAVLVTERLCDTYTWTVGAAGQAMIDANGAPDAAVHSPADNTPGAVFVAECGNGEAVLLELYRGTATGVNALVTVGS